MRLCTGLRLTDKHPPRLSAPRGWEAPVASMDVRRAVRYIEDQGQQPICVAKTAEQWEQIRRWRRTHIPVDLNTAPDWYERAKKLDGLGGGDGTTPDAMFQVLQQVGVLSQNAVNTYLAETEDVIFALAAHGPVWGSFHVPASFEFADAGGWFRDSDEYVGYHEMLVGMYDDSLAVCREPFIAVLNSWGNVFGWNGWARMTPYQFTRYFVGGNLITDIEQRGCL